MNNAVETLLKFLLSFFDFNKWYEKIVFLNCKLNKMSTIGSLLSLPINAFLIRPFFNCDIAPGASLGRNVKLPHCVGIVIGGTAIIGVGTVIMPNVVIGAKHYPPGRGKRHATIGENCLIGANTTIMGNITIGNNCIIGAGSYVDKDVPDNTVVRGINQLLVK